MSVQNQINRINNEVSEQTELIEQITTALAGKAAGGGSGGGSVDTCTLKVSSNNNIINCVYYTSYENNSYIQNRRVISTTETVLENVLCNSSILIIAEVALTPGLYTQDDVIIDNCFSYYYSNIIQIHCTSIVGGQITVIQASSGGND